MQAASQWHRDRGEVDVFAAIHRRRPAAPWPANAKSRQGFGRHEGFIFWMSGRQPNDNSKLCTNG
jgi:hypothetical protein